MDPKKILTSKSFCAIPWTGFQLTQDGTIKNCVIAKEKLGNIHTESIENILKISNESKNIKQQMLDDRMPNSCNGCYWAEQDRKSGFESISSRLYYMKEIASNTDVSLYDNIENFELKKVDLRWTNACNQACVYCGPHNSSKWAQELGKKVKSDPEKIARVKEFVFQNVKTLKHVYLAGGEPMLMKENKEFLELLIKENPDINLRVNTNLSYTNTGIFDLICKFTNVHWTVSIDTIKEQYEYVRFHGKWEEFKKNLSIIRSLNHKISFNMLWFILNYKSIFETVDYFLDDGFHPNSFIIGPVFTPLQLNVLNLPDSTINQCENILNDRISKRPGFLLQNSYENLLKHCKSNFDKDLKTTFDWLKTLDARRGIDSKKIFPELYSKIPN